MNVSAEQRLITALADQKFDEARQLLLEGVRADIKTCIGFTPLHYIAMAPGDRVDLVDLAVHNGASYTDFTDNTLPIHLAARRGNTRMVVKFVLMGMPFDTFDHDHCTPLLYALRGNHLMLSHYLLDLGADPKITGDVDSPLTACQDVTLVKRLLTMDVDINQKTFSGTALSCAALYGFYDVSKLLLEHEAKVSNGHPLHSCCIAYRTDILDLLLSYGGKINCTNRHGDTPLHWVTGANVVAGSALSQTILNFTDALVARGANVNAVNKYEQTPLSNAISHGHTALAEKLKSLGAHV